MLSVKKIYQYVRKLVMLTKEASPQDIPQSKFAIFVKLLTEISHLSMTFFNIPTIRKLVMLTKEASPQDIPQSKFPIFVELLTEISPTSK